MFQITPSEKINFLINFIHWLYGNFGCKYFIGPFIQQIKLQHIFQYIIGQRGKGIQEILDKYHVSVEVPNLESSCSNITLRGQLQNLGSAVSEVYDRAESYKIEKIRCPNWLHRYLIGKDGSKLQEIVGDNISKVRF